MVSSRGDIRADQPWTRWIAVALGAYALLGGAVTFAGWAFAIYRFTDWVNDGIAIKTNAALCLASVGLAVVLLALQRGAAWMWAVRVLGAASALLGALTLLEHATGWNPGIDTLIFDEPAGARATAAPGRMGPPAAGAAVLLGVGLVLASLRDTSARRAAQVGAPLAMGAICIGMFSLFAYLFGAVELYSGPSTTAIAVETVSMVIAAGIGLVVAMPEAQPMQTLLERGAAATLARRALPLIIALPILFGWLRTKGEELGFFGTITGRSLLVLALVFCLGALLWWAVAGTRRAELALRSREQRLAGILGSITDGFITADPSWRITFVNDQSLRLLGTTRDELLGRDAREVFPEAATSVASKRLQRCVADHVTVEFEDFDSATSRWFACKAYPTDDGGVAVCFDDVTERKRLQDDRQRAETELRAAHDRRAIEISSLQTLHDMSARLLITEDPNQLLEELIEAAIAISRADKGNIQLNENGALTIAASRGFHLPFIDFFNEVHAGDGACGMAMRSETRVVIEDVTTSPLFARTQALGVLLDADVRAVQSTPLLSREGKLVGILSTHYSRPTRPSEDELRMLDLLARQAADWIERMQTDVSLRAAREEQSRDLHDALCLQQLSLSLVTEGNTELLYKQIVDATVAIMRCHCGSLQMLCPTSGALRLLAHSGFTKRAAKHWEWVRDATETTCAVALRTGKQVITNDIEHDYSISGIEDLQCYRDCGVRAVLSTPLMTRGGELVGMISALWNRPYQSTARERRWMVVLARQAADVIERNRAEGRLRQSEQRFRSLVSVITDVPWTADASGAIVARQLAWEDYTGQTWDESRDFGWANALHPDDRTAVTARWQEACRTLQLYEARYRVWHAASKQYRHVVARATPVMGADGSLREWVGACTDVEDEARAHEQLEGIVEARTTQLRDSLSRLQASERLAALGDMAAGLGDDIADMVLPIRLRLEALAASAGSELARADIDAIGKSLAQLSKLSTDLRLMALDPARDGASAPVSGPRTAALSVANPRTASLATTMLAGMRLQIVTPPDDRAAPEVDLWVAESPNPTAVESYLAGKPSRRLILVDCEPSTINDKRVTCLGAGASASALRDALTLAVGGRAEATHETGHTRS